MSDQNQTASNESLQNLEDIYQLSPMQQGMLFHSVFAPQSGTYFEQTLFTIKGDLDAEVFAQAWQAVVDRHSILRTSFLWEELEKPVQVVHRQIDLAIAKHDWQTLTADERQRRLETFINRDRAQDFVISEAPLLRLALFRFAENEHKFLFSRHHLLLDRWSRSLLFKDFLACYETFAHGEKPDFQAPRPYAEYVAWLTQQDQAAAEIFWRSSLAGLIAPTSLSVDRPTGPKSERAEYDDRRVQLSETTTDELRLFAREHRLTLNTLAQAAWALVLSRYSNDDDVLFGITVSGRSPALPGIEGMVGLFINTLPLRVKVSASADVLSWLHELQEQQTSLQQYEYSSLVDIQGWSEVPRGTPLFESIFVFENLPAGDSHQPEHRDFQMVADRGFGSTTGYPLTVIVSPGTSLTVQIVYDRARFTANVVSRMLGHFQTVLESLAQRPTATLAGLPLLTKSEQEQIVNQWNETQLDTRVDSVVSLFEAQVERTPDATAGEFEGQKLSYRELNARANQLANYLRASGIGTDDRVGICIDRSLEMIIAVLGSLKAGAAYVPLDPAYPGERLNFMMGDAQCKTLLTSASLAATLPQASHRVLCLDQDWHQVAGARTENPPQSISPESLAYVIYTSGSTGWPKGVALPHRALDNLITWQLDQSFLPARTLQFASLSFDVSFQEMFATWCSGGTLLLVSDELRRDAPALLRFLDQQQVERIFLPFVYLQHLAEAFTDNGVRPDSLREIITAGEQLEITPAIANLCGNLNDFKLHNQYGPSETHVVTAYTLSGNLQTWPRLPPIGRPISNTQIYVLDRNGQPAPVGVTGELCIGGVNLARGYLNRPELTAEKFVSNPFSSDPAARIYRTGDAARFGDDGNIEFLGRLDNQIKIRGFRIELGEIESTLLLHSAVRETVVVAHGSSDDRRLLAYVVAAAPEPNELRAELRDFLQTKLPNYMVPSDFMFLESLPLTPSGKINRRALPEFGPREDASRESYVAPHTEVERQLTEIWASVLKRDRVGVEDDFFELGGHSLLATQLISQVRKVFRVEVPLRYLFEYPTVAGLARGLDGLSSASPEAQAPIITRAADNEAEDLLARIDELSDEQVEALLSETLG